MENLQHQYDVHSLKTMAGMVCLQPPHAQVYLLPKATPEVFLIALAVRETRA